MTVAREAIQKGVQAEPLQSDLSYLLAKCYSTLLGLMEAVAKGALIQIDETHEDASFTVQPVLVRCNHACSGQLLDRASRRVGRDQKI